MTSEKFQQQIIPLGRQMFGLAYAILADSDEAADAVQDVMESLWRNRDKLDAIESTASYCLSAARHKAIDLLRQRGNASLPIEQIQEPVETETLDADDCRLLEEIIATLPEQQQAALRLSIFESAPTAEIAEQLGVSPDNARQLLSRARKKVRNLFKSSNR